MATKAKDKEIVVKVTSRGLVEVNKALAQMTTAIGTQNSGLRQRVQGLADAFAKLESMNLNSTAKRLNDLQTAFGKGSGGLVSQLGRFSKNALEASNSLSIYNRELRETIKLAGNPSLGNLTGVGNTLSAELLTELKVSTHLLDEINEQIRENSKGYDLIVDQMDEIDKRNRESGKQHKKSPGGKGGGDLGRATKNTKRSMSDLLFMANPFTAAFAAVAATVYTVAESFRILDDVLANARFQEAITKLGAISGQGSLTLLASQLQDVSAGSLSAIEALQLASKTTTYGFSSKEMIEMTELAKKASIALGINYADALERLTKGIQKQEVELLDELGIVTRLEPAMKTYAQSIGKTVDALTDAERKQALYNEATRQARKAYGDIDIAATGTERFAAAMKTLGREMATAVAPAMDSIFSWAADRLSDGKLATMTERIAKALKDIPKVDKTSSKSVLGGLVSLEEMSQALGDQEALYKKEEELRNKYLADRKAFQDKLTKVATFGAGELDAQESLMARTIRSLNPLRLGNALAEMVGLQESGMAEMVSKMEGHTGIISSEVANLADTFVASSKKIKAAGLDELSLIGGEDTQAFKDWKKLKEEIAAEEAKLRTSLKDLTVDSGAAISKLDLKQLIALKTELATIERTAYDAANSLAELRRADKSDTGKMAEQLGSVLEKVDDFLAKGLVQDAAKAIEMAGFSSRNALQGTVDALKEYTPALEAIDAKYYAISKNINRGTQDLNEQQLLDQEILKVNEQLALATKLELANDAKQLEIALAKLKVDKAALGIAKQRAKEMETLALGQTGYRSNFTQIGSVESAKLAVDEARAKFNLADKQRESTDVTDALRSEITKAEQNLKTAELVAKNAAAEREAMAAVRARENSALQIGEQESAMMSLFAAQKRLNALRADKTVMDTEAIANAQVDVDIAKERLKLTERQLEATKKQYEFEAQMRAKQNEFSTYGSVGQAQLDQQAAIANYQKMLKDPELKDSAALLEAEEQVRISTEDVSLAQRKSKEGLTNSALGYLGTSGRVGMDSTAIEEDQVAQGLSKIQEAWDSLSSYDTVAANMVASLQGIGAAFTYSGEAALSMTEKAQMGMDAVAGVLAYTSSQNIASIDAQIAAEKKRDGKSAESLEKIKVLEKKRIKEKEKADIASIGMSTAAGIMNAFSTMPYPAAIIASAGIAALGMIQLQNVRKAAAGQIAGLDSGSASPSKIQIGERDFSVDLGKAANAGELQYLQGAQGVGTGMGNFTPRSAGGDIGVGAGVSVGENGPEVFIPTIPGYIANNSSNGGASTSSTSIVLKVDALDSQSIIDRAGDIFKSLEYELNARGKSLSSL